MLMLMWDCTRYLIAWIAAPSCAYTIGLTRSGKQRGLDRGRDREAHGRIDLESTHDRAVVLAFNLFLIARTVMQHPMTPASPLLRAKGSAPSSDAKAQRDKTPSERNLEMRCRVK